MAQVFLTPFFPASNVAQLNYTQVGTFKFNIGATIVSAPILNKAVGSPLRICHKGSVRCLRLVSSSDGSATALRVYHNTMYAVSNSTTI